MATYELDCAGCNRRFKAKAPNAKWHDPACKKRAQRVGKAEAKSAEPSRLIERLRADLEAADQADTFEGLLALELAERIVRAGPQGFSTLVRELRSLRAKALGEELPPPPGDEKPDEEPKSIDPGMALVLDIEERRDSIRVEASATG